MNYLFYSLVILLGSLVRLSAEAGNSDKFTYKIKAEIEGLSKGDTICFEEVSLPEWNLEPAFKIIVENEGEFSYEGSARHSQYLLMTYKPLSGEEVHADRRGVSLLVNDGCNLLLKGNAETIYYCEIEGGVYDNADFQEINSLERKLGKERALYSKLIAEANASGDTEKANEYIEKFNTFALNNRAEYEKKMELQAKFAETYPSSELNIIENLQRVFYTSLEKLEAYYSSMDEKARKSYYGILLRQEIDNIAMLEPGNDAPDFVLNAMDGQQISLGDYSGSYLLIYHFGLCPGSLMIDREVTSFYANNKDRLKMIGITEDMSPIKNWYETVGPTEKMMNIELKPALESMISHPWTDVENKGDNRQLSIDYAFGGMPFFVFISPEGKILSRGFHETFHEAKKIIEEKFNDM